jgi:tetratricopeptide (TPR) repeat protein
MMNHDMKPHKNNNISCFQKKRAGLPALFSHTARLPFCLLLLAFCLALGACQTESQQSRDDITLAEAALQKRDIGDAEMHFERYLRKNPQGELRWYVWEQLLNISMDLRQDRKTSSEYMEIMLLEFADVPDRRRELQLRLADLSNELHEYGRATELWEDLVQDPGTPDKIKARVHRDLAHAYLRRLEFIMATETLEACLHLQIDNATKAECLYSLGEAQSLTEDLTAAEASLRSALDLPDTPEHRRVLFVFMLADVLEQQGNLSSAITYFETIRTSYPNEKVVELRIANLKKMLK